MPGAARSPQQDILAGVLGACPVALASHTSAAFLYGAEVAGAKPVHVTVGDRSCGRHLAGVVVHRPRDGERLARATVQGIGATVPVRTVLDCGAVLARTDLGGVVEALLVRKVLGLDALERAVAERARSGRPGIAAVRAMLREYARWAKPPDSVLEVAFGSLLAEHGLPPAEFHRVVRVEGRTFELDFAYLGVPVSVNLEIDGWASHGSPAAFEANRERDAVLQRHGWVVQRFTWFQVMERPAWVAGTVRDLLAVHGVA